MTNQRFPDPQSVSKDEIPEILTAAMREAKSLPLGPDLVRLMALWRRWMEGRGYSGGTGDWFVYFLKWALMGRVKAFVEWVEAHPSADGELALAGIRQVYDFHWPHNASCGYIFHGLWGWLQLELEKPGEKAPPSIAEQMEYITRHLEAQGMRVKAWTSLGPGGVMGIPEPMEKAEPVLETSAHGLPHRSDEHQGSDLKQDRAHELAQKSPFESPNAEVDAEELIEFLEKMTIEERIEEISEDVYSKRDKYRIINPFDLADLLDVPPPHSMDGWFIARYLKKKTIYEIIEDGGYENFDTKYVWEKMCKCRKKTKLKRFLSECARFKALDCKNIDDILKKFDPCDINAMVSAVNSDIFRDGDCGVVIGYYEVEGLCFEAILDIGDCVSLKGPYEERDGEFFDTTDCLEEDWI